MIQDIFVSLRHQKDRGGKAMFTIAIIICLLIIFIAACLLPWWFIPAIFVALIVTLYIDYHKRY